MTIQEVRAMSSKQIENELSDRGIEEFVRVKDQLSSKLGRYHIARASYDTACDNVASSGMPLMSSDRLYLREDELLESMFYGSNEESRAELKRIVENSNFWREMENIKSSTQDSQNALSTNINALQEAINNLSTAHQEYADATQEYIQFVSDFLFLKNEEQARFFNPDRT